jgi:hypothetical protein
MGISFFNKLKTMSAGIKIEIFPPINLNINFSREFKINEIDISNSALTLFSFVSEFTILSSIKYPLKKNHYFKAFSTLEQVFR